MKALVVLLFTFPIPIEGGTMKNGNSSKRFRKSRDTIYEINIIDLVVRIC